MEIIERLGVESLAYLQAGFSAQPLTMRQPPMAEVAVGDSLSLAFNRDHIHCFDATGRAL